MSNGKPQSHSRKHLSCLLSSFTPSVSSIYVEAYYLINFVRGFGCTCANLFILFMFFYVTAAAALSNYESRILTIELENCVQITFYILFLHLITFVLYSRTSYPEYYTIIISDVTY